MMKTHEYTFDVRLFATVRVHANSPDLAGKIVKRYFENAALANAGGERAAVETTLSLGDCEPVELIEIDGEEADRLQL